MSTNVFKSFAVAGVGNTVGMPIVKSLLSRNAQVIVLTRPSSKKSLPDGVKTVPVDYSDTKALAAALRENSVDVVISTLSGEGLHAQYKLADAAKAAGVKLFVPSEFGMPTKGATEGVLAEKNKLADYAQSIGLPITRVYNGLYQEFLPFMVGMPEAGKFLIEGSGNEPLSLTAMSDVGGKYAPKLCPLILTYPNLHMT
ncbi:NmrA-like domain-containing protein [Pisolithus albus]|nr:NmrA-like domain-containing protein [Pisolithus albus]